MAIVMVEWPLRIRWGQPELSEAMHRNRIMNMGQGFDFVGNGGLWGFDRRYVGLDKCPRFDTNTLFNII